jgi:hypothetical protein
MGLSLKLKGNIKESTNISALQESLGFISLRLFLLSFTINQSLKFILDLSVALNNLDSFELCLIHSL